MKNLNACLASLNLGLPDDVRRLKEAGYYTEAIACIDTYLAEDWTKTQNQPVQPAGPLPENPTPHGVDAMRDALLAQREIRCTEEEGYLILPILSDEMAAQLTRLLAQRHLGVIRLEERQKSLEDIFLELTGKAASL